ncbi:Carnitine O-acetyltransferase mitochondrial [Sporothrix epigloea]|uniref:Carnitine O-acetyltransferase mitochondrial n=1 Tax=Sporothrix epigloea TaxID=1892477 RepID=A0ABP0DLV5_9PEZI
MAPPAQRKNSTKALPKGYVEDKSKGPMLRFQESLPHLPVPTLDQTAARYVKSLRALYSAEDVAKSEAIVKDFIRAGGVGEKLQEKLLARRSNPEIKNWLTEWWNDAAYLAYRDPVIPYVSYFYSHRDDRRRRDPSKRAAALTTAALEFKKMVDQGTLEPEYMKGVPICMDSYKWMFNCNRIPAHPKDHSEKHDPAANKHIAVVRNNRFYKVMHEVAGRPLNTSELEDQFRLVYKLSTAASNAASGPAPPVGFLTTENRDVWADARKALIDASPINAESLAVIDSAAFLVCLDEAAPVTFEERAHQYWHGNGSNRWFDKPLQFIICDNGTSGFMGEHSMMDGTPTHRLNDWVNEAISKNKLDFDNPSVRADLPEPVPINFKLTGELKNTVAAAGEHFNDIIGRHELAVQSYQGYGKGLIKKFRVSPDAYVQMIIQLAYYKMYGKNRPTYESAATRFFQLGRTETCRSVSEASVAFCKAMNDDSADNATREKFFRDAAASHIEYISSALDGMGVDRHLFGLKKLLEPGEPVPAIFADPAYAYSSKWFLSTSQLSSEYFNGYGWSQVVDEGFGIAYMINENSLNFNIVSKGLGSSRMSFYLNEAANDIRELLTPSLEAAKAKL